MKKCRRCSKPATLHITEIREGKAVALHLCETCARDYLESSDHETTSTSGADVPSKLEELANEGSEEALAGLVCPHCGITFAEFRESGRFGCPGDYTEFMAQILPLLENIHEGTTHIGKRPRHQSSPTSDFSRLIQMRKELQEAIEREDYESAAQLRDTIASLESDVQKTPREADVTIPPQKPATRRRRPKPDQTAE